MQVLEVVKTGVTKFDTHSGVLSSQMAQNMGLRIKIQVRSAEASELIERGDIIYLFIYSQTIQTLTKCRNLFKGLGLGTRQD